MGLGAGMIAQVANGVQGCRSSERHGLGVPDVTDATNVYPVLRSHNL